MPDRRATGDSEGGILGVPHPALCANVIDVEARVGPGLLINRAKAGLPDTVAGFVAEDCEYLYL